MKTKKIMGKEYRMVRITIPVWVPVDAEYIGADSVSLGSYPDKPGTFTSNGVQYFKGDYTSCELDEAALLFRLPPQDKDKDQRGYIQDPHEMNNPPKKR